MASASATFKVVFLDPGLGASNVSRTEGRIEANTLGYVADGATGLLLDQVSQPAEVIGLCRAVSLVYRVTELGDGLTDRNNVATIDAASETLFSKQRERIVCRSLHAEPLKSVSCVDIDHVTTDLHFHTERVHDDIERLFPLRLVRGHDRGRCAANGEAKPSARIPNRPLITHLNRWGGRTAIP